MRTKLWIVDDMQLIFSLMQRGLSNTAAEWYL